MTPLPSEELSESGVGEGTRRPGSEGDRGARPRNRRCLDHSQLLAEVQNGDPCWFICHIDARPWFPTQDASGQNFGFIDGHAKYMSWEASLTQGGKGLPGMHNIDRIAYDIGVQ